MQQLNACCCFITVPTEKVRLTCFTVQSSPFNAMRWLSHSNIFFMSCQTRQASVYCSEISVYHWLMTILIILSELCIMLCVIPHLCTLWVLDNLTVVTVLTDSIPQHCIHISSYRKIWNPAAPLQFCVVSRIHNLIGACLFAMITHWTALTNKSHSHTCQRNRAVVLYFSESFVDSAFSSIWYTLACIGSWTAKFRVQ